MPQIVDNKCCCRPLVVTSNRTPFAIRLELYNYDVIKEIRVFVIYGFGVSSWSALLSDDCICFYMAFNCRKGNFFYIRFFSFKLSKWIYMYNQSLEIFIHLQELCVEKFSYFINKTELLLFFVVVGKFKKLYFKLEIFLYIG